VAAPAATDVVRGFRTHHLSVPLREPLVNGTFAIAALEHVLLEIEVEGGTGIGYALAFERRQAEAIRVLVADLAETLVGTPVGAVRGVWKRLWTRIAYVGQAGPAVMALSAVDTALWDLLAQRAGLPLFRLLGAARSSLPVYVTGGWLGASEAELAAEARAVLERGIPRFKLKVGNRDWRVDVERVARLRAEVPGLELMVDANQAWTAPQAIAAGRALAELGVTWLEEPVAVDDLAGGARVAAALELRVASGESLYTSREFKRLLEAGGADVLMPDLSRSGGPAEFLRIATLAEARGLPVSSHLFPEISAHLMAACPNATLVELVPEWSAGIFDRPPLVEAGRIHLPERPGLGFGFAERAIRDFAVEAGA
jgi:L-alanine-DL-glutamate epimerase-like enolase superfamily enzyme